MVNHSVVVQANWKEMSLSVNVVPSRPWLTLVNQVSESVAVSRQTETVDPRKKLAHLLSRQTVIVVWRVVSDDGDQRFEAGGFGSRAQNLVVV